MTTHRGFALEHQILKPRTGSPPDPAVMIIHGRGANEFDLLGVGPELDPRLFVISPRAPHTLAPGSYEWFDLQASLERKPSPQDIEDSLRLVMQLIDESIDAYELDAERFFIGGFSMGGAMSAAAVLTEPDRFAGALIFSGYVPIYSGLRFDMEGAKDKPVFLAHGIYDNVLPIQYGRMSRQFLTDSGVNVTYREYPIEHSISGPETADAAAWLQDKLLGR